MDGTLSWVFGWPSLKYIQWEKPSASFLPYCSIRIRNFGIIQRVFVLFGKNFPVGFISLLSAVPNDILTNENVSYYVSLLVLLGFMRIVKREQVKPVDNFESALFTGCEYKHGRYLLE